MRRPKPPKEDVERRLSPPEASALAALLDGRNSWQGQHALARTIGIDPRLILPAIRREPLGAVSLGRIRSHLARLALAARGSVPVVVVHGGVQ